MKDIFTRNFNKESLSNSNWYDVVRTESERVYCEFSGLLSINGVMIGTEVYAWVIVFALPVNSAVNPILYTVFAVDIHQVITSIILVCRGVCNVDDRILYPIGS